MFHKKECQKLEKLSMDTVAVLCYTEYVGRPMAAHIILIAISMIFL